jgi:hypothetical protein
VSPAVIVQKGHGRRTRRAIKVLTAPAWITLTAAAQVAQVRRTTTRSGKKTVEVVYVITLRRLDGATNIAASPRHHARQARRPIEPLLTS